MASTEEKEGYRDRVRDVKEYDGSGENGVECRGRGNVENAEDDDQSRSEKDGVVGHTGAFVHAGEERGERKSCAHAESQRGLVSARPEGGENGESSPPSRAKA
jgi:hypothetical protein